MNHHLYFFILLLLSCGSQSQTTPGKNVLTEKPAAKETCWAGSLNKKTPIFIHYQVVDSHVIIGEITYLNSKNKVPIRLLGTVEEDRSYHLLEFDASGNITGMITGTPATNKFMGTWFSPKTGKELPMMLATRDTVMPVAS